MGFMHFRCFTTATTKGCEDVEDDSMVMQQYEVPVVPQPPHPK